MIQVSPPCVALYIFCASHLTFGFDKLNIKCYLRNIHFSKYFMKKNNLLLISIFLVAALLVGALVWKKEQGGEHISRQTADDVQEQKQGLPENLRQEKKGARESELVWYEIPELGIRFKVDNVTKEELLYNFVGFSGKNDKKVVDFSTKTLTDLSMACSVKEGGVTTLSRRFEKASGSAPCGGGKKVYEYSGGYFCFTLPQSDCLGKEKYDQNQGLLGDRNASAPFMFMEESFWNNSVEFTDGTMR